jgi:hypothetical protein
VCERYGILALGTLALGNNTARHFTVGAAGELELHNLVLAKGKAVGQPWTDGGGNEEALDSPDDLQCDLVRAERGSQRTKTGQRGELSEAAVLIRP